MMTFSEYMIYRQPTLERSVAGFMMRYHPMVPQVDWTPQSKTFFAHPLKLGMT
jgi:hypothetical protein